MTPANLVSHMEVYRVTLDQSLSNQTTSQIIVVGKMGGDKARSAGLTS